MAHLRQPQLSGQSSEQGPPRRDQVAWQAGELLPRVGFIVSNLSLPARRVAAFYVQRGTAEQHISKGKNVVD